MVGCSILGCKNRSERKIEEMTFHKYPLDEQLRRKWIEATGRINKAHQQHRRADAHLKCNRFDEAIQCHQNAAKLLLEAMKTTTSPVALESLTLQHTYHLKQNDFIKNKKEHFAKMKKAIDNMKCLQLEQGPNVQFQKT